MRSIVTALILLLAVPAAADTAADGDLCFAQLDCNTCLETLKANGDPCQWYVDETTGIQWCQTGGCDMNGICGVDTCPQNNNNGPDQNTETETNNDTNTTAPTTMPESANNTDTAAEDTNTGSESDTESNHPCLALSACQSCLSDTNNDCAWIRNSCQPSCDGADDAGAGNNEDPNTQCFHPEFFPNATISEICEAAGDGDMDQADVVLCGSKNYCFTCTSTIMSDGESTCSWYKDESTGDEWCGIGGCDSETGVCGNPSEEICQVDTGISTTPPPDSSSSSSSENNGDTPPAVISGATAAIAARNWLITSLVCVALVVAAVAGDGLL